MRIEKYEILFDLNDSDYSYEGRTRIYLEAEDEGLTLNVVNLEIKKILVNEKETTFSLNQSREELSIEGALKGDTVVDIEFIGHISKTLTGFYLAKLEEVEMFTTQFESSGARRAFPCVDHPAYKARFSLSLRIREALDAISNMPTQSIRRSKGRKTVTFEETPRMSTYLLYIGVGKFEERTERYSKGEIILIAPKGHLTPSHFPLDVAKGSLLFFEDYFAVGYMLPKLHLISVPEFAAGAMENWGAITMRKVYMDMSSSTSGRYRRLTAEVIAHEIAHQWFGDLVTMKWWNDLWLNESFATFVAYKVVNRMFPEWDSWSEFLISATGPALKGDGLVHSHPIDADVKDPSSVAQIFDEISYGKGGSILRMIESYVGKGNFRDGIRSYLQKHAYANAMGKDLWNAMEKVSGLPVGKIMGAWIKTQGYPLVTVTRKGKKLHLEQKQFFLKEEESDQRWPIPITVRRKRDTESILFEGKEIEIEGTDFLKLNPDQTGFYRVSYDEETLKNILSNLSELSNLDRWGIANDLYALLMSGKMDLGQYLHHMEAFKAELNRGVVEEVVNQLSQLYLLLPDHSALGEFSRKFFRTQMERLGDKQENEPENETILRGTLSREYSIIDQEFALQLSGLFLTFQDVDPDMRSAVALAEAIAHNDFSALHRQFGGSINDEDRTKLINAMGWLYGHENLKSVVDLIRSEEIKKQDTFRFYLSASANPKAREFMLDHLEFAVKQMKAVFVDTGTPSRTLEQMIPLLGIGRKDRVVNQVNRLRSPDIETGIRKGLEFLEIHLKCIKSFEGGKKVMKKWVHLFFILTILSGFLLGCTKGLKDTIIKCPKCGAFFSTKFFPLWLT
jgi:tricorn protease interacting factor F2/3